MNIVERILNSIVDWVAPAAMIVLIIFLIKDVKEIQQGQSNIGKAVVKVLCIFLIVGIMYATTGFENFGNVFKGVVDEAITEDNLPSISEGS